MAPRALNFAPVLTARDNAKPRAHKAVFSQLFGELLGKGARDKRSLIDALERRIEVTLDEDWLSWPHALPFARFTSAREGVQERAERPKTLTHRGMWKLAQRAERGDAEAAKHADELGYVRGPLENPGCAKAFPRPHGGVLERFYGEGGEETRRFSRKYEAPGARRKNGGEWTVGDSHGALPARMIGDGIEESPDESVFSPGMSRWTSRMKQERSRPKRFDPRGNCIYGGAHAFKNAPLGIEIALHNRDVRA